MKSALIVGLFMCTLFAHGQVWLEDFTAEVNGATSGTATGSIGGTWSTIQPSSGTFSRVNVGAPYGGILYIDNTTNEGIWQSNTFNISALGEVALEVVMGGVNATTADYVRAYYRIDGGPEVMFAEVFGTPALTVFSASSAVVTGTTLQIVIRGRDNSGGGGLMGFDDVTVTDINVLYSIASNNWNNTATWSTIGFAGASCGCTPDADSRVIIGNGRTVNFNVSGTAAGVEIQSTGRLNWTANTLDLAMARGGALTVQLGGVLSRNGRTGTSITFGSYTYTANVNGSVDINTMDFNSGANITVNGAGTITVDNILLGMGTGKFFTNNITGPGASITVSTDLAFEAAAPGAVFTNNGTLVAGRIFFDDDNVVFTNNGTLTSTTTGLRVNTNTDDGNVLTNNGSFTVSTINLTQGAFTLNNAGTIDQSGDFSNVDATSNFYNLAGGTWNFGGSVITNVRLFADNNSNTFNYNRAGAQSIITPQDAYSNLTLSNSGAKTALASFAVRGNWSRTNTATYATGGFTVSLTGTTAQTVAAVGGETFTNLTINNTFGTSPQITLSNAVSVATTLTMTAGNINLNGNTFTLSSSAAGALSHSMAASAGYMYGGSLVRNFPTTAIAVGNVAGFYPLGAGANFRPFFIGKSNIALSNGTITISHTDANSATNVSFTDNTIPPSASTVTVQRRHDSFWTVAKSAGMTAGSFDLRTGGTGFTIGAVADLRLTRLSDATAIGTATASTGTPADARVNRTGLVAASLNNNFYLASLNAINSPLPITLAWFRAVVRQGAVVTTWKTLQEKNNHFFTVQKTTDLETFYEVGTLEGQGDSQQEKVYTLTDDSPFSGRSYYRLKQTDFDGKFTFSPPVLIEYESKGAVLLAYPNPFDGSRVTLELKDAGKEEQVVVELYSMPGRKIADILLQKNIQGTFKTETVFSTPLPPGMYILRVGNGPRQRLKILVE